MLWLPASKTRKPACGRKKKQRRHDGRRNTKKGTSRLHLIDRRGRVAISSLMARKLRQVV